MGKRRIRNIIDDELPELTDDQFICQITETRGGGLYICNTPLQTTEMLVSLPSKFNNIQFIKRGSWVVVEEYHENDGGKVGGVIQFILKPNDVKVLKGQGKWCTFKEDVSLARNADVESAGTEDEDDDLFENNNRYPPQ